VDAEAGRVAAYADLVAAVLDLRSPEASRAFDAALSAAVDAGALPDDLARQLRWLQRQSERALVEHAETVLPPALVALQRSITPLDSPAFAESGEQRAEPPVDQRAEPDDEEDLDDFDGVAEPEPAPVVQLQARRLLVAGLRPLPDPAHRGTLPS
jgi:hypothetical protein